MCSVIYVLMDSTSLYIDLFLTLVYTFTIQTVIDMLPIPSLMPIISSIISLALHFQKT